MSEEKPKNKIEYVVKKFLGKSLVREGVRKHKETGEDIAWKLWKLEFAPENEGGFNTTMQSFDNISAKGLQIKDLEEGQEYNIGFVVEPYEHPEHGTVNSKKVKFIGDKPEQTGEVKASPKTDLIKEFIPIYKDVPNKKAQHFIGAFMIYNKIEPELVKELVQAFKDAFVEAHDNVADAPVPEEFVE